MTHALAVVSMLTDAELDGRLQRLVRGERQVLVLFLAHLGEFERRRVHEDRSYPSAFEYCTKRLGLSEAEAFLRIRAARIVRDYPEALEMLADGGIHLSGLARLSPHLSAAVHRSRGGRREGCPALSPDPSARARCGAAQGRRTLLFRRR